MYLQLIQGNDVLPVKKEYNDKSGYNSRGIVGKLGYTQIEEKLCDTLFDNMNEKDTRNSENSMLMIEEV